MAVDIFGDEIIPEPPVTPTPRTRKPRKPRAPRTATADKPLGLSKRERGDLIIAARDGWNCPVEVQAEIVAKLSDLILSKNGAGARERIRAAEALFAMSNRAAEAASKFASASGNDPEQAGNSIRIIIEDPTLGTDSPPNAPDASLPPVGAPTGPDPLQEACASVERPPIGQDGGGGDAVGNPIAS
jgi:hypothetical protein